MKKLITLIILSLFALTSKAQTLTFEETVKYINNQITCCEMHKDFSLGLISANKEGFVSYYFIDRKKSGGEGTYTVNITDLERIGENSNTHHNGITRGYDDTIPNLEPYFFVKFYDTTGKGYIVRFKSETICIRVFKAFIHLQTLCTPTKKDPFDN